MMVKTFLYIFFVVVLELHSSLTLLACWVDIFINDKFFCFLFLVYVLLLLLFFGGFFCLFFHFVCIFFFFYL